jgi:hypothetical protein
MGVLWAGIGLGTFLFLAKMGIFYLLTSVKNKDTGELEQRMWPKWFIFGERLPLRDRIHESTFLLVCVDTISGYLGMHIFAAFNGGIIAMVGMATYTIVCAFALGQQFIVKYLSKRFTLNIKRKKKQRYSWQEA